MIPLALIGIAILSLDVSLALRVSEWLAAQDRHDRIMRRLTEAM